MEDKTNEPPAVAIPASLIQQGEAVARIAIELAREGEQGLGERDVEAEIPNAWRVLRKACLEVETTGRTKNVEDYKRLHLTVPKALLEALKPPPPPLHRELFDKLFNKARATVYLPSTPIVGLTESIEWRQLTPWDSKNQHPSEERKTRPYKIAWASFDGRLRECFDTLIYEKDLVDHLCHGFRWEWKEIPVWMAANMDMTTGIWQSAVSMDEWRMLEKCSNELPRPHNRSVCLRRSFRLDVPAKLELAPDEDKGLPGPTPPEGTSVESLYEQVKTWAENVLEAWKKAVVEMEFKAFWAEGKEHGFLWEDVKAMAPHTKKHQGGIKGLKKVQ